MADRAPPLLHLGRWPGCDQLQRDAGIALTAIGDGSKYLVVVERVARRDGTWAPTAIRDESAPGSWDEERPINFSMLWKNGELAIGWGEFGKEQDWERRTVETVQWDRADQRPILSLFIERGRALFSDFLLTGE